MAPLTGFTNPNFLRTAIHGSSSSGDFMATGAGDNSYQSQITGLLNSGNSVDQVQLRDHLGREYYRKLDTFGLTPTNKDTLDAGFRPTTFTGLYTL